MASSFKKTKVKLESLTDTGVLLMVGKGIRGGICHAMHRYRIANKKYMKDYDVKILYGLAMSQKLSVYKFE